MLPIKDYIEHPEIAGYRLLQQYFSWLPDKLYVQLMFRFKMGYWPDLENPQTFSEKLQWLKLYNRRPEYTTMVDKFAVKEYVANIIGEEYIIPTLGVWDKPEDIEWDRLPDQFVLKTTHGGGSSGVVICKDRATFDKEQAIARLNRSMKQDIYRYLKEWPYKNVRRRVIAEKYIEPKPNVQDLTDYKWYCFDGVPKFCQVIQNRNTTETIDFFDTEWNHQDFVGLNPKPNNAGRLPARPYNLEVQIKIARELSQGMPFARIDLYNSAESTFFGEITLYPTSGLGHFRPDQYNEIIGEMLELPGERVGGAFYSMDSNGVLRKRELDLPDYKFFCFDGVVKALFIGTERQTGNVKFDYFDANFNHLDLIQQHPLSGKTFTKPDNYEKMKELAAKLSKGIPQVRIDLYDVNGKIYFGEMTFYHHGGVVPFHPSLWDSVFGSWIILPFERKEE